MADDNNRDDRPRAREMRRARREERYGPRPTERPVGALGVVALVIGVFALVGSMIPCVGMFAIPVAAVALVLSVTAIFIARAQNQSMGTPVTATAISGSAVVFSLLWMALFGSLFRDSPTAHRPSPPPPPVLAPAPPPVPPRGAPPQLKPVEPKLTDEQFEKKLLEDLAKDRVKEAIRNGPGVAVTAAALETTFTTNTVAADVKYKDKVLEVTGQVVRVVQDNARKVYTLELATDEPTKTVSCDFTEQTKYPLASVERGKQVTVRGLCVGRDNEFVKVKDCVVVK